MYNILLMRKIYAIDKTKIKIIYAALDVLHRNASAPLGEIAKKSGITRMTLHRHFTTRQKLILAAFQEVIKVALSIIEEARSKEGDPVKQLEFIVKNCVMSEANLHFLWQFHESLHAGQTTSPLEQGIDEISSRLSEIFRELRHTGNMNSLYPDEWLLHLFDGIILSAYHSQQYGSVAPRSIPELAWQSFYFGLAVRKT